MKFVFKLTFKRLKGNLIKERGILSYNKKFDSQFYDFYFKDTAVEINKNISGFYDPLNSRTSVKTLNSDYIKLIFCSSRFKNEFLGYLAAGRLLEDYQTTLKRKIWQILYNLILYSEPLISKR